VLEIFLEAILWKPFQLFRRILNDVNCNRNGAVPSMLISVEGTGKYQQQPGQESMWDVAVLSRCSLLRYT
jgi:hypothetical protein